MSVLITWLGHSCFALESQEYRIVVDPYKDNKIPGIGPLRTFAHEVYCSHEHEDHCWPNAVEILTSATPSPWVVKRTESDHDEAGGALRGHNIVHVFEADGLRIGHFGDIGTELSAGQVLAIGLLDVAMIPVGGYYTVDAIQANAIARSVKARVVIPMHFKGAGFGFDLIDTVDPFLKLRDDIVRHDGPTILVDDTTAPQVALLSFMVST